MTLLTILRDLSLGCTTALQALLYCYGSNIINAIIACSLQMHVSLTQIYLCFTKYIKIQCVPYIYNLYSAQ